MKHLNFLMIIFALFSCKKREKDIGTEFYYTDSITVQGKVGIINSNLALRLQEVTVLLDGYPAVTGFTDDSGFYQLRFDPRGFSEFKLEFTLPDEYYDGPITDQHEEAIVTKSFQIDRSSFWVNKFFIPWAKAYVQLKNAGQFKDYHYGTLNSKRYIEANESLRFGPSVESVEKVYTVYGNLADSLILNYFKQIGHEYEKVNTLIVPVFISAWETDTLEIDF